MQERIREGLENYLSGRLPESSRAEFDEFLRQNPLDRAMIEEFRLHGEMIRDAYGISTELAPGPGFYARVCARIEAENTKPSFWSIFLEPFGSRLVYASAALLLLLGVAFYSAGTEPENIVARDPSVEMLVDRHPEVHLVGNQDEDRGRVLETLTVLDQ